MVHGAFPPVLRHVMMGLRLWRSCHSLLLQHLLPGAMAGATEAPRSLKVRRRANHRLPGGGTGPQLHGTGLAGGLGGGVGLGE